MDWNYDVITIPAKEDFPLAFLNQHPLSPTFQFTANRFSSMLHNIHVGLSLIVKNEQFNFLFSHMLVCKKEYPTEFRKVYEPILIN